MEIYFHAMTDKAAIDALERQLIKEHRPPWNIQLFG
jgi:hypothetical protein